MTKLFEFLSRKGLSQSKFIKTLSSWNHWNVLVFLEELFSILNGYNTSKPNPFGFICNNHMSGGRDICSHTNCRFKGLDTMARFAALYADHVLVQDPFDLYGDFESIANWHRECLLQELAQDISILHYLKPLIESNIITLVSRERQIGQLRYRLYGTDSVGKRINKVRKKLHKLYLSQTKARMDKGKDSDFIAVIEGPDDLYTHGSLVKRLEPHKNRGRCVLMLQCCRNCRIMDT
jgi:hypothetical protein